MVAGGYDHPLAGRSVTITLEGPLSVGLTADEVAALREVLADPETYAPLLWITDEATETRREYEHSERAGRLAALAAVASRLQEVTS